MRTTEETNDFGKIRRVYSFAKMYMEANTDHAYHNWNHAKDVAHASLRLSGMEGVAPQDRLKLLLASLMHDIYVVPGGKENEEISAKLCEMTLPNYGINVADTMQIADLVRVTDLRKQPQTLLEKIMRDADVDSLGRKDSLEKGKLVMQELGINGPLEGYQAQLKFQQGHHWYTRSAQATRQHGKQKNIRRLEQEIRCLEGCDYQVRDTGE